MSTLTAYVHATIYPVAAPPIYDGIMLVRDGKILAVGGADLGIPDGAELCDMSGLSVMPGLVDAHSHVGIMGDGEGQAANDSSESAEPVNAKIRVIDSVNPRQRSFAMAREGGITTSCIIPLGNPIAGLTCVLKTAGDVLDDMVLKNPAGLKSALGEAPKRSYGQKRGQPPFTRMGIACMVRNFLAQAEEYNRSKAKSGFNESLENGAMLFRGEIPLRIHAHRQDDIVTAVRIAEEFGIAYRIEHCTEGHLVADFLARHRVTAHVGPGLFCRTAQEWANADERNAAILEHTGVKVCLITDHPFLDSRYLMTSAAMVHKYGMSFAGTLRSITLSPAESLGIERRVGSLEPGKDADFVVLSGRPFSYKSVILATYINGVAVYRRPEQC